jgi:hypothetical protein
MVDCSGVIIKLNSVQLQLQLPAGTELGKNYKSRTFFLSFLMDLFLKYIISL